MAVAFESFRSGSAVHYGKVGGIWVMVLHRPPVEADMLFARPALAQMAKSEPGSFPTLTWILPSAGFSLDAASRDAAAKITSEFSTSIRARATLIEGDGFRGAAVRSIVAGIDLFSRTTSPGRVFGDLSDSVSWCLPFRGQQSAAGEPIVRALSEEVARLRPAS